MGGFMVQPISFKRHRFLLDVICYAVWLYFRFTMSIRNIEELLAHRGFQVRREAVRCWVTEGDRVRPAGRGEPNPMFLERTKPARKKAICNHLSAATDIPSVHGS